MKKKILIVGFGSIGKKLLKILPKKNYFISILRTKKNIKENTSYKIFFSVKEARNYNPDYVFICTSANLHYFYFNKLKDKCKNFFIEKPLTNHKKEIEHFNKCKLNILIGYFLRFHQPLIYLNKIIRNKINKIKNVNFEVGFDIKKWRPTRKLSSTVSVNKKLGGGALFELSHEIDLATWMLGFPDEIFCDQQKLTDLRDNIDDSTKIIMNYNLKKISSLISMDLIQSNYCRKIKIILENEVINYDFTKNYITRSKNNKNKKIFFKASLLDSYKKQIHFFLNKFDYKKRYKNISDLKSSLKLSSLLFNLIKSNNLNKKIKFKNYES